MFTSFSMRRWRKSTITLALIGTLAGQWLCHAEKSNDVFSPGKQGSYEAIDLSLFADSIHHWQMKYGRDRNDPRFKDNQIIEIAENLLKFQNNDGGWPANLDWLADIEVSEIRYIRKGNLGRSTFDNRNIYPQIEYLAKVHSVTDLKKYRMAAKRGLEYILTEQRSSGGWRGSDVDAITFNDDVMVGVMRLLLSIREGPSHFEWLDAETRKRLSQALERAIDATLKCQIHVRGRRTAWGQQHSHKTYKPVGARTYELPSITAQESVGVVRFLMALPNPSSEIKVAIESAMDWFERSKINGIRINTVPIEPVRFEGFTASFNRIVVADEQAPPIWARFYEIDSNRPFFCNRDGTKVYRLADVQLERRVGYGWYGSWPTTLKSIYSQWEATWHPKD